MQITKIHLYRASLQHDSCGPAHVELLYSKFIFLNSSDMRTWHHQQIRTSNDIVRDKNHNILHYPTSII
jgi:hypothetical protein